MSWEAISELVKTLELFQEEDCFGRYSFLWVSMSSPFFKRINSVREDIANKYQVDVPDLIASLINQRCQDPKHKIFNLLDFSDGLLPTDFVDYKQLIDAVSESFTKCMIEEQGNLEFITYLSLDTPNRRPSWIPIWHQPLDRGIRIHVEASYASQERSWKQPACDFEGLLAFAGRLVGALDVELKSFQASMHSYFYKEEGLDKPLQGSYREAQRYLRETNGSKDDSEALGMAGMTCSKYATQQPSSTFIRAFLRAVFCHDTRVSAADREVMFRALIDDSGDLKQSEGDVLANLLRWGQHPSGLLLLLASGRLAYVSHPGRGPEAGDHVTILHDLKVPCLLRKSEDCEVWLYVTDLYVRGMMHGEAVDWEEDEADTFILV